MKMKVETIMPWEFALLAMIIVFHSATTDDTTTEVPMTWNTPGEDESSTVIHGSLPTEIFLDLRDVTNGHEHSKLRLVKKADDVEHVQVITRHRGRERDWKMRRHEHFSVYSDQSTLASFSVSIDDRDATKMMMFGSFMLGKDGFSLSPLKHSFSESGQVISINGSLHVLTVEEHLPEQLNFDNLGERSYYDYEYGEDYNYILSKSAFMSNKEVYKRRPNVKQNLTVELFVVLDYSIYKKWLDHSRGNADAAISGLRFYYAHILNGMNDRYEAIDNPDFKISIKPAGYYLARSRSDAPFTEDSHVKMNSSSIQAYKALDNFYRWITRRVRYQNKDMPRFDASALFTDYVLMASDTGSRSISGLADIGAVCKVNAVSINKDFGQYGTIDTATHELGHNLGALHDGSNNTCSTNDQFIMASSPFSTHESLFFNPYNFSTCSIKYLKDHFEKLNSLGRNCLLDGVSSGEDHKSHLSELPGQKFTLDEQCKILFGKDSFYCAGGGDHGKAICRSMFCWKPATKTCMTDVRMRAADGTPCHNKSWCIGSKCVADSRAPAMEDVSCPHGDFKDKIPFWNTGQIACKDIETKVPHLCYHTYYENLCCETCKKMKRSVTDCEYGDRNKTACADIPTNYCYDKSMKHECCETCDKREDKSAEEDCKYGDKVTWCSNQIHFKSSGCYRAGDKKLCCKTCQNFAIGPPGCEYGDRGEGCKKDHCQSESHRLYCCKTCGLEKDFLEPSFNLTSTTTTIRPTTKRTNLQTNLKCSKDVASWCTRIKPSECYRSSETCCYTCQQYFNPGKTGCEYGDKKESCSPDKCSRGNWYLENCCYSCAAYLTTTTSAIETTTTATTTTMIPTTIRSTTPFTTTKLTSTFQTSTPTTTSTKTHPKCPRGDMARWCSSIKPSECYRSAHICCLTCLDYLDQSSKDCSYGDRRSDCKLSHCTSYLKYDCCKTCSNFVPTTTPNITTAPTTISNAILEVVPVDIRNCKKDKQAWCVQMSPHECYLYSMECCATCSGFYNESFKGCEFGDRESMCASSACKDSSYSKICCKTCNHASADSSQMKLITKTTPIPTTRPIPTTFTTATTTRTTPTTITTSTTSRTTANQKCPRGDLASWCSTMKSYDCYTSAHLCCSTCLQYLDESSKDCRYGNRRSDCEASKCDRVYKYYCCRTCMNATATTTTTSTTTTTTTTTTKTVYDVDIPNKTPSWNDVIDEDPKTQCPNGDLASWCPSIKPYDCYKSSKICCSTCLKYYDKNADYDCEYGDKVSWCENHVRKSAEDCKRPSSSVATKCCKSCKEAFLDDPEYLITFSYVRPTCSHGDEASFCQNIEPSSCYNNYRTCCRTCASYFDSTIPECPYGDKADWCKKHATSAESCNRKDIASRCCHTCFYLTSNGNITQSVGTCDDIADWCKTIVARQCYQSRAEFTCCSTCRRLRKNRTGDCRYGNHVSWCGPQYCSSYSDECCETCA